MQAAVPTVQSLPNQRPASPMFLMLLSMMYAAQWDCVLLVSFPTFVCKGLQIMGNSGFLQLQPKRFQGSRVIKQREGDLGRGGQHCRGEDGPAVLTPQRVPSSTQTATKRCLHKDSPEKSHLLCTALERRGWIVHTEPHHAGWNSDSKTVSKEKQRAHQANLKRKTKPAPLRTGVEETGFTETHDSKGKANVYHEEQRHVCSLLQPPSPETNKNYTPDQSQNNPHRPSVPAPGVSKPWLLSSRAPVILEGCKKSCCVMFSVVPHGLAGCCTWPEKALNDWGDSYSQLSSVDLGFIFSTRALGSLRL